MSVPCLDSPTDHSPVLLSFPLGDIVSGQTGPVFQWGHATPRQEYTGLVPSLMGQPTVLQLLLHIFSMGSIWSLSSVKSELLLRSYLSCQILLPPFIFFWENFTVGLLAQEFTPQALCLWNLTWDTNLGYKLPEVRQWVSFIHCSISSTRTLPDICRCLNYFEWLC